MDTEDSVEITALSIDEAILVGLTRLAATRDEVDIAILDEGSRGFLGLGTRMATVRLTRRPPETNVQPEPEPEPELIETVSVHEDTPPLEEPSHQVTEDETLDALEINAIAAVEQDAPVETVTEAVVEKHERMEHSIESMLEEEVEQAARIIADSLLSSLSVSLSYDWQDEEERPTLWISIKGTDADAIVGPRAQTLNSVQYLFRTLVHRQVAGNYDLVVDADGYRMRRRRNLEKIAYTNAEKAVQSGQTVRLRSMPAHERRIIHIVLRDDSRVETRSVGAGRDRAVTIIPTSPSEK